MNMDQDFRIKHEKVARKFGYCVAGLANVYSSEQTLGEEEGSYMIHQVINEKKRKVFRMLKETSTLKASRRLIVGNTVLFQISVESPATRNHCQAKQGLPITYICF